MSELPDHQEPSGPSAGASASLPAREPGAGGPQGQASTPGPDGQRATYYRCRCIALEAAVESLQRRLERRNDELDEVVSRYEQILQRRGIEATVTTPSRGSE